MGSCYKFLESEWGYDKYGGVVHIIPNAGVCVMALLYGEGDLARTIEIATAAGWDTDCNAGNVGSILGTLVGLDGISAIYREPINDMIVASSVSGYLNIVDLPSFSKLIAILGHRVNGLEIPKELSESYIDDEVYFDFELPGSTHGFRTDIPYKTILKANDEIGYNSSGSFEVFLDRMVEGEWGNVFYPTFYRRSQFNDEKYKPTFSPKAYSGQQVSAKLYLDQQQGSDVIVTPYVKDTYNGERIKLAPTILKNKEWQELTFTIPNLNGSLVEEVGYLIESPAPRNNRTFGSVYIDEFHIYGEATYSIDFSKQVIEFLSVTPFAHHRGEWSLQDGNMIGKSSDETSASFTGHYYAKNGSINAVIRPVAGNQHAVIFRSLGTERYYQAGFINEGKFGVQVQDFGLETLIEVDYTWDLNKYYEIEIEANDNHFRVRINGEPLLTFEDDRFSHGMVGFSMGQEAQCEYKYLGIRG